jgi:hypothetical protein
MSRLVDDETRDFRWTAASTAIVYGYSLSFHHENDKSNAGMQHATLRYVGVFIAQPPCGNI